MGEKIKSLSVKSTVSSPSAHEQATALLYAITKQVYGPWWSKAIFLFLYLWSY